MIDTRANESLALLGLLVLIWFLPVWPVYAICFVTAFVFAVRWDAWYFGLLGAYAACMVAVHTFPGPYDAYASEQLLVVLKAGITIITGTWLVIRNLPMNDTRAGRPAVIPVPIGTLRLGRWLCLSAGMLANYSRYSQGTPLFAEQVDVVRQYAREQSNIVTGFLSEGWTIGVMLTIAPILVERRRPRLFEIAWLAAFTVGAFAGASRNALLIAVVPAILVGLHFRRSAAHASDGTKPRKFGEMLKRLALTGAVGALITGLMWFASRRILNGTGAYERVFSSHFADDPLRATAGSLDMSLSGSFETLSRLIEHGAVGGPTQFTIFQGFGAITRWMGYEPDLYSVTGALSAPYHMITATYLAAPIVDFGILGGIVASFVLGVLFGSVDRWLSQDPSVAGQLIRFYVVYIAIFSVYEFQPFVQPAWMPVLAALFIIRQRSLQEPAFVPRIVPADEARRPSGAPARITGRR